MMYEICTKFVVAKSYLPAPKHEMQKPFEKNVSYNMEM